MLQSKLNEKQIKEIKTWITISEVIEDLYDVLFLTEVNYGVSSPEYERVLEKLKLSLETERDIEKKYFCNEALVPSLRCLQEFSDNQRLLAKLYNDYDACFAMENYHRAKRADFFELFGIKPQEASKHNDEDLEFSKKYSASIESSYICKYSYRISELKTMLSLISRKIEDTSDEKLRSVLIAERNQIISNASILEDEYFSLGDISSLIIDDEAFVAKTAGVTLDDYKEGKALYFLAEADDTMQIISKGFSLDEDFELYYELKLENLFNNIGNQDEVQEIIDDLDEPLSPDAAKIVSKAMINSFGDPADKKTKKKN